MFPEMSIICLFLAASAFAILTFSLIICSLSVALTILKLVEGLPSSSAVVVSVSVSLSYVIGRILDGFVVFLAGVGFVVLWLGAGGEVPFPVESRMVINDSEFYFFRIEVFR